MPPWGLTWKGPVIFLQQTQGRDSWRPWWKVRWKATWRGAVSGEGVRTFLEDGFHMEVIMTYTPCTAPIKQHQMKKLLRQPHSTEYFVNLAGRKKSSFHHQAHIPSVQFALLWNQKYGMQKALQSKRMLLTSCLDILLGNMLIVLFTTSSETGQKQPVISFAVSQIQWTNRNSLYPAIRGAKRQRMWQQLTDHRWRWQQRWCMVWEFSHTWGMKTKPLAPIGSWKLWPDLYNIPGFFFRNNRSRNLGFWRCSQTIHPKNLCLPWSLLFLCLYCLLSGVVRRFWPYFIPVPDSHGLRK